MSTLSESLEERLNSDEADRVYLRLKSLLAELAFTIHLPQYNPEHPRYSVHAVIKGRSAFPEPANLNFLSDFLESNWNSSIDRSTLHFKLPDGELIVVSNHFLPQLSAHFHDVNLYGPPGAKRYKPSSLISEVTETAYGFQLNLDSNPDFSSALSFSRSLEEGIAFGAKSGQLQGTSREQAAYAVVQKVLPYLSDSDIAMLRAYKPELIDFVPVTEYVHGFVIRTGPGLNEGTFHAVLKLAKRENAHVSLTLYSKKPVQSLSLLNVTDAAFTGAPYVQLVRATQHATIADKHDFEETLNHVWNAYVKLSPEVSVEVAKTAFELR